MDWSTGQTTEQKQQKCVSGCNVRGGAGVFDPGVSLLALYRSCFGKSAYWNCSPPACSFEHGQLFPLGAHCYLSLLSTGEGRCRALTNEWGGGGRGDHHLQLSHAVPSSLTPNLGCRSLPGAPPASSQWPDRWVPVYFWLSWEMVLPKPLLQALALSRPGSSWQAGAEALPSLLGPCVPPPWQAAGNLQNMDQHNFSFLCELLRLSWKELEISSGKGCSSCWWRVLLCPELFISIRI